MQAYLQRYRYCHRLHSPQEHWPPAVPVRKVYGFGVLVKQSFPDAIPQLPLQRMSPSRSSSCRIVSLKSPRSCSTQAAHPSLAYPRRHPVTGFIYRSQCDAGRAFDRYASAHIIASRAPTHCVREHRRVTSGCCWSYMEIGLAVNCAESSENPSRYVRYRTENCAAIGNNPYRDS